MSIYILWKENQFEGDSDDLLAVWSVRPSIEAVAREIDVDLSTATQPSVYAVVHMAVGGGMTGWSTVNGKNYKIDTVTEAAP